MHPANNETIEILLPNIDQDTEVGLPARVILYNDEDHTFDEVIHQIAIATGCTTDEAMSLTNEVHSRGKAQVSDGPMNTCLRVSTVLEEIALHTQVEL